eukprot:jgi/Tetstr1/435795/TSEL_024684.t1
MATLRAPDTLTQDRVDALDLLDAAHRTLEAVSDADEARLTYLRRFKAKKALTPEEQALEDKRLEIGLAAAAKAHASATFKRQAAERDTDRERKRTRRRARGGSNNAQDIGASAHVTVWIRDGVRVPFRYNRPPPRFNQGVSFNDATPAQLKFLTAELRRFTAAGAWEKSSCAWWVSRAFFVPKPGDNQWRFIIDLRVLNTFCARKRLRMETLMGARHLTAKGDYMFSFDPQDGFYALGIAPSDRDYFTVNIRGTRYRLSDLPIGHAAFPWAGRSALTTSRRSR